MIMMHMYDICTGMPGMGGAMPGQPIQPFHPMVGAWPGQGVRMIGYEIRQARQQYRILLINTLQQSGRTNMKNYYFHLQ